MPIPRIRRKSEITPLDDQASPKKALNFIEFLRQETQGDFLGLLVMGSISGIASAALLAIINVGAETANQGYVNFRIFLLFLIGIALFVYCKRYVMNRTCIIFETVIYRICQRQIDKLRHASLQEMEALGRAVIYSRLTRELDNIAFFAPLIVDAALGAVLVLFSLFYLYMLSKVTLVLLIGATVFGGFFFLYKQKEITRYLEQATEKEVELFGGLSHVLDGFKEIKLNQAKNNGLMEHINQVGNQARDFKIKGGLAGNLHFVFSQLSLYMMLGAIVFVLPHFVPTYPDVVIKTTVAILFMMGSLEHMVGVLPHYANINVAIRNVYTLEAELDRIDERNLGIDLDTTVDFQRFRQLRFERIYFHYKDLAGQPLFSIGPLDFSLEANEIVFIVGGNGSGKSTFIKVLTGLYFPESGSIQIDGRTLAPAQYVAYRDLFGGVLTDFHLFDRFYGMGRIDEVRLKEWLRIMQLDHKTAFVDGRFTNLDLSTGQKARLALIITLMEDKPIYVLDEWAAPQDPEFRRYFYEVILADLKKAGKTVIVVSHDDRYFHIPNRILKMEYGQVVQTEQ